MSERLHKVLAHCGVASRRQCEVLIEEGRVEVNGKVVTRQGTKVEPDALIRVDGENVKAERKVYYLLNKPKGYLCTAHDNHGRACVTELIREEKRIYPVGRLDENSEGLIILTNDGTLTNVICHPRYQVDKTYKLTIRGRLTPEQRKRIESGVWLAGGKTAPAQVKRVAQKTRSSTVTITIWEGRNRELRRIFAKLDLKVNHLVRTAIGPLKAHDLPIGSYVRLAPRDIAFATARLKPDWKPKERPSPRAT